MVEFAIRCDHGCSDALLCRGAIHEIDIASNSGMNRAVAVCENRALLGRNAIGISGSVVMQLSEGSLAVTRMMYQMGIARVCKALRFRLAG